MIGILGLNYFWPHLNGTQFKIKQAEMPASNPAFQNLLPLVLSLVVSVCAVPFPTRCLG